MARGAPDKLNWDYSVDGSAEFKPEVMFDDGHSIWMRMPAKAQTWPVPYKDHGDRVVGNFIRRADFLIFQRLADKIVLLSGKDEDGGAWAPARVRSVLTVAKKT
ncbi:hypothetical protein BZM26_09205 [Paraburkholderia strydomiana]|nr:hypothetical protein BZM26_09205 [Paraburkholderia strydomiana]